MVAARSSFRVLEHLHAAQNHKTGRKVLIYGVGKTGVSALKEFLDNTSLELIPVGFIDDSPRSQGKEVNGVPVVGTIDRLDDLLKEDSISEVILAINDIPKVKLERLSQICSSNKIPLRRFQTRLEEILT